MSTKTSYQPTLKDRVDSAIILCGFNLYSYCSAYGVQYTTLLKAIAGERGGRESRRVLRRLSAFFEEQGLNEMASELRETARLMEMEAA